MGITIEQYRSRTGAHNNVEIKKHSTQMQLEGNLLSHIMLMLFQLVINTVLIVLLQVFYLCILYLPTQKLAGQIACFRQATVSFSRMSCYIVNVALLLKMANDVNDFK